jgi:hypothetical protein
MINNQRQLFSASDATIFRSDDAHAARSKTRTASMNHMAPTRQSQLPW